MLLEFFRKNKTCHHLKVRPDVDFAYCPDCGELIENRWYLLRCACCGVKLRGIFKNGEIVPENHFCHNCGAKNYTIEQIDKINFIDINYAVLVRTIVSHSDYSYVQSWVDAKTSNYKPKLLLQYR